MTQGQTKEEQEKKEKDLSEKMVPHLTTHCPNHYNTFMLMNGNGSPDLKPVISNGCTPMQAKIMESARKMSETTSQEEGGYPVPCLSDAESHRQKHLQGS